MRGREADNLQVSGLVRGGVYITRYTTRWEAGERGGRLGSLVQGAV